jgi:hypothetical protein
MRTFTGGTLGLALLMFINVTAAKADKDVSPFVVSLRTCDGSSLTGLLERGRGEPVEVSAARLLAWEHISAIELPEDDKEASITLRDGEVVRGRIVSGPVQIITVVGRLSVPWARIEQLTTDPYSRAPDAVTHEPAPRCPVRFEVTLHDGSWILGTPENGSVSLNAEFGDIEVPWARVREVSFHEDYETCTLKLWNEDVLVGCVDWRSFTLSTGLGSVKISPVHTKSMALSLGGIDLVAKPYKSATGNRHFLVSIKSTLPRRIRGRTYPAAQLIEAHASGRIEYVFEEPVQEFHGTIAMYETYCAKKGNVVFKLETEDGLVYASRPIRNFQQEEVYVRFRPTKRLILITDQNGAADEDWSVWLRPEAR